MSRSIPAGLRSVRQIAVVAAAAVVVPLAFVVARVGPAAAAPTRYEAETAVCQGTVDSDHTGFTGTGFCNTNNATGASVEWTVTATTAGTATLGFRYANGTTTNRPMSLTVNGTAVGSALTFAGTGAWTTWQTATATASLVAGSNTVRLTSTTANGGPNLDWLEVDAAAAPSSDYQAEDGVCQGTIDSDHAGFTGTGFCNTTNAVGSYVEWTVPATAAADVSAAIRYANGTTANRPMTVAVNGSTVTTPMFAGTGAWETWRDATFTVHLNAGTNKIRATSTTANGGPNIDRLIVGVPGDTEAPSVPGNPRTSDLTCNSVTFAWDASSDNVGVAFYDVYHDGQLIKSVSGGTLSTSITPVQGVTWGLYVNARDAAGNVSQASDTVPVTPPLCGPPDTEKPTAPGNLTGTASGTSVNLTWTASTDNVQVLAYDVYRDNTLAGTVAGTIGNPPGTTFTDSGLTANTTYSYYVTARDPAGNLSAPSTTATVHTGGGCTNPVCTVTTLTTEDDLPWGLVTLPDGTILYNRRDAHDIIHLNPATGKKTNLGTVPNVQSTGGEGGLTGLEINPVSFSSDHWLYIMHTSPSDNRIVRIKYDPATDKIVTSTEQVLLSGILRNKFHDGGRLRFSPDGRFLYAGTGDAQNGANAQNKNSLNGKVLRINPDGSIPADNPFGNPVWSYGHRNVQGLAFDSQGRLWEQEFGNSIMDETNLIQKGGNYGWPSCEGTSGSCGTAGFIAPKHTYPVASGSCSGITIIRDVLYVACERGTRLYREVITGSSLTNVTTYFQGTYGRLRTVEPAPDGGMWMTTSSGDKDSTPHNSNDRVFHVQLGT
jgi:glucose/arabinose dehydrogenase